MINAVTNALTRDSLVNLSQNAAACVSIETAMKAIGRPGFILLDKDLDKKTKQYAATKEFLYQIICLGVYLAIIPAVFKKGTFALAKKLFKGKGFEHFKNSKEFLEFYKLAIADKADRLQSLNKGLFDKFKNNDELMKLIKGGENLKDKLSLQKGAIETGSFIGSILGLTILAPEISHHLIHPIMRFLHLENDKKTNQNSNNNESRTQEIIEKFFSEQSKIIYQA